MKLSKLLFSVLAVFLLIGFASCSDDDDDAIVGTWGYSKTEVSVVATDKTVEGLIKEDAIGYNDGVQTITFNKNGTFVMAGEDEDGTFSYRGSYVYKDNLLTTTIDGEEDGGGITKLVVNKNALTVELDETEDYQYDYPQAGISKVLFFINYTHK